MSIFRLSESPLKSKITNNYKSNGYLDINDTSAKKSESINENVFINKEDIRRNVDNWGTKPYQDNILYVTGFSGSGKTTLSKDYSKRYGAEVFSLDFMDCFWEETLTNRFLREGFKKFPEYKSILSRCESPFVFYNREDIDNFLKLRPKVLKYIIDLMHEEKNNLFIIEGIQILYEDFPIDLNNVPLILKGTSGLKSFVGRTIRSNNGRFDLNDFLNDYRKSFKGLVLDQDKIITRLRKGWQDNKHVTLNRNLIMAESCDTVLQESYKSKRNYKCPFCSYKNKRQKLIYHIEKKHEDMIPENYSAGRLLYDIINTNPKKGKCRICGNPTEWDEDKLKYKVFCNNPKCKKAYSDEFHKVRMVNIYGVECLLNDPNMQAKMLKNRRISGYYKFKDGARISYCGQYEKNLLEFLDNVMNYQSYEVTSPGPIIEYEYKGKKHTWITDQYIGPANLVIDCKDGGDNPNTRNMEEYREKQKAKEEAIAKSHKYNYIRLTNNDFSQLIEVLMDIKYQLMENPILLDNPIIHINENTSLASGSSGNAIIGTDNIKPYLIAFKPLNSTFVDDTEYALTFDKSLTDIYSVNNEGYITHNNIDFLFDKKFDIIESEKPIIFEMDNSIHDKNYFCQLVLNSPNLNTYKKYSNNIYHEMYIKSQIDCESILYECSTNPLDKISEVCEKPTSVDYVTLRNDINGYFLYNKKSKLRTKSYDTINEALDIIDIISKYKMEDIV